MPCWAGCCRNAKLSTSSRLLEHVAVAIWRQRLVRAPAPEIDLVYAGRGNKLAAGLVPLLGRIWDDALVRAVVAEKAGQPA